MEVVHASSSIATQHARSVRVIDHHDGPVFVGKIAQLVDRADVAIHREHAVGDQELVTGLFLNFLQQLFSMRGIAMTKNLYLGAR